MFKLYASLKDDTLAKDVLLKMKSKMLLLNSRFKFGEEIKTAEVIDATDKNKVRVNGTEFFERVKLTEKDLENLELPVYKTKKTTWRKNKPFESGDYCIVYNSENYYLSYLDELDLFNQVVRKKTTSENFSESLQVLQELGVFLV